MEPLTHFLTGACIGRAGFNRKTAYATMAAVMAAEAADLDVLWGFAGPVESLKHHRGITHTFIGVPVVAAVVLGAVWLWYRWRGGKNTDRQPVRWAWLYLTALVAALSHILLDWTNNYGVRPFFPFNPRWYAGSFVFIAEPLFWALLVGALAVPWILGMADSEIGARKQQFQGQAWAIFALMGMLALGSWRWLEHAQGLSMLDREPVTSAPVTRVALEPYPVNPFRWHAILETQDFYQTAELNTRNSSSPVAIASDPKTDVLYKPTDTPAIEAAKRTLVGRVYLDWGSWPLVRDIGPVALPALNPPDLPPNRSWTTVQFTDLRFAYSFTGTRQSARAQLGGWVYIVDNAEEAGEGMGARVQATSDP